MSQTWTDRVVAGLDQLQAGQGQPADMRSMVETTAQGVRQQLDHFRLHWPEDPEITEQEASFAERSLVDLSQSLEALGRVLQEAGPQDWAAWGLRIRASLEAVRSVRDKAQRGPTSHPLVNRLLMHLQPWQQGQPTPAATQLLLELLPDLEEQWDRVIGQLDESSQGQLAEALLPALQVFDAWRDHLHGPPPPESAAWQGQVVEALDRFDQILGLKVQADLSAGPTPFPVLNLLVTAAQDDPSDSARVRALAQHSATLLRLQTNAEILKQSKLLETLAQLEAQPDNQEWLEVMVDQAEQLGALVSVYATPDSLVDLTNRDGLGQGRQAMSLPPMLSSLHRLAADCVEGRAPAASLKPGIVHLERILERFAARVGQRPEAGMELALEDLGTAVELLRDLESTPSLTLLEEFEEVLADCAESLAQLEPQRQRRNRTSTS